MYSQSEGVFGRSCVLCGHYSLGVVTVPKAGEVIFHRKQGKLATPIGPLLSNVGFRLLGLISFSASLHTQTLPPPYPTQIKQNKPHRKQNYKVVRFDIG